MAVAGPSCRRPAGRPAARRRRGPWAAGLGSRRDRGAVPPVGPARPLPPQARPPWLLPGPGVGVAVTAIEDLVSRKWLAEVVSVEETSVQVQAAFCQALEAEGLMDQVAARLDGTIDLAVDDPVRPILLALSLIHPEWRADRACGVRPAA